ncbi:MAG: class I SAM-dependent methyltransferase [Richelia sp. RM2_1_2]|nr:class I SAM-dependent methyltransferase [Richelia sp. SM2_1_7]NJM20773.1 class I SAM-dependent methyltransferase [Richelia sp. SM1_7_0]NJN11346.1 class I SAM-dependent methyltransferase [Richelia sp. RM1_1_1]NJO30081.1 class I SAM-dependent methyltransferase [Richelia sp. SL_2_1]NJO61768.1 class I SAM-dependent methyltransferase [Richelia sp. RM2_1_2]
MHVAYAKASEWAKHNSFGKAWRLERMKQFLGLVKPPSGAKIIDLGGHMPMWQWFDHDFEVTLVNLPGSYKSTGKFGKYTLVEGDATNLCDIFADKCFDIVFSNSVIEHVGDESKQADFASEVKRLAKGYWVQTPSLYWPLEPHTGVIGYWLLPEFVRQNLQNSWEKKLPVWTEMVRGTRVLSQNRMRELFTDSKFYVERKFLLEKSYAAYKPFEVD